MVTARSTAQAVEALFAPRLPAAAPTIYVHQDAAWEYKLVTKNLRTDDVPTEAELNQLGHEGWELAASITDSPFVYLYFKRPAS